MKDEKQESHLAEPAPECIPHGPYWRIISVQDTDALADWFHDPGREMPLVLISPTRQGHLFLSPDLAACRMHEFADVAVLEDEDAAEALKDTKGPCVWGGSVLILGTGAHGQRMFVRVLTPEQLTRLNAEGRVLEVERWVRVSSRRPDAVAEAGKHLPELILPATALRSSKDCPYAYPDRAYQALVAMNDAARAIHNGAAKGWRDALGSFGTEYRSKVSEITLGRFGNDYEFYHQRQKHLCTDHLTLGAGMNPVGCMSIHWKALPSGKLLVPHVGRHLRTHTQN